MNKRKHMIIIMILSVLIITHITCYAVTDAEVQSAVEASGKEGVSGNLFIWFLCAVAFIKVSQKIDSFMSSLGISVGRTGGSMLSEAMIVAKGVGTAFKTGGFAGFRKNSTNGSSGTANPVSGNGILGGIGRKMSEGAANMATGKNTAGGIMASIGKKAYEDSVGKGGSFAAGVISSIARGEISKMGTITGSNGKSAIESYFGYNANINKSSGHTVDINMTAKDTHESGGATTITYKNDGGGQVAFDLYDVPAGDIVLSSGGSVDATPIFSEIEMGGGRITGMETTGEFPDGRQFAMYDAEKYAKPEGKFETVTAIDNSKWYKQYSVSSVERTPYMDTEGKIQYKEKIVNKMPKAPMRKDKM